MAKRSHVDLGYDNDMEDILTDGDGPAECQHEKCSPEEFRYAHSAMAVGCGERYQIHKDAPGERRQVKFSMFGGGD